MSRIFPADYVIDRSARSSKFELFDWLILSVVAVPAVTALAVIIWLVVY